MVTRVRTEGEGGTLEPPQNFENYNVMPDSYKNHYIFVTAIYIHTQVLFCSSDCILSQQVSQNTL